MKKKRQVGCGIRALKNNPKQICKTKDYNFIGRVIDDVNRTREIAENDNTTCADR